MRGCACLCLWFGGELVVIEQRILYLPWFTQCRLGKREQNFGLFMFHILLIFELLLSKFNKWFLSDKSSKVVRRWLNYANVVIVTGDGLQNDFFCRKPRCLLFLEECWINCFIRCAIKRSMLVTFNQEFTAFNEPMFLFLFTWCLIFCLNFPS